MPLQTYAVTQAIPKELQRVVVRSGLALSQAQVAQLSHYVQLLLKWSTVYNLTAIRDLTEVLQVHIADSLAVVNPLRRMLSELDLGAGRQNLLDVGSGAGLPGVVLAIVCPDLAVTCVDAVQKKAAFIQQVALSLRLTQLTALHARVETLRQPYQVVCSRAFASLNDFTRLSQQALAEGGVWLAMKGKQPEQELAELPQDVDVFHVEQLWVPDMEAQRCIVWMRRRESVGASK